MNKPKWLLFLPLLYNTPAGACSTICKEVAFDALTSIDYAQTNYIFHSHGQFVEYNPLISQHNRVPYFLGTMLLHGAITYALPKPWRSRWQNSSLLVEGFVVGRNAYLGIGITF
jgi:hypothetical protein